MGTWPHMATVLVPIYGPYGLPISFLDLSNGEEYASPGKEIWRQRMELILQKAYQSLPSGTAFVDTAGAQCRTAIA
jgi:hypothetical protein